MFPFPLPYKWLAGVLILAGIVTASWLSGDRHATTVMQEKIDALKASYQKATIQAQEQAQAKQEAQAKAFSDIAAKYEQELIDASKQHAADIVAIRSGALRLRDKSGKCSAATEVAPSSAGSDGETGCTLSADATGFLLGLADEADRNTRQLAACQAIVTEDRQ